MSRVNIMQGNRLAHEGLYGSIFCNTVFLKCFKIRCSISNAVLGTNGGGVAGRRILSGANLCRP